MPQSLFEQSAQFFCKEGINRQRLVVAMDYPEPRPKCGTQLEVWLIGKGRASALACLQGEAYFYMKRAAFAHAAIQLCGVNNCGEDSTERVIFATAFSTEADEIWETLVAGRKKKR